MEKIIKEGINNTVNGNFTYKLNGNFSQELLTKLQQREEVADVKYNEKEDTLDIIFYLNYCPNANFTCIKDFQGTGWYVDHTHTIEEWRDLTIGWAESDGMDEMAEELKKMPVKKVIETISDIWELEIVPEGEEELL